MTITAAFSNDYDDSFHPNVKGTVFHYQLPELFSVQPENVIELQKFIWILHTHKHIHSVSHFFGIPTKDANWSFGQYEMCCLIAQKSSYVNTSISYWKLAEIPLTDEASFKLNASFVFFPIKINA